MNVDPGTWPARRFAAVVGIVAVATRLPVFLHPFLNGDEATYTALANAILDGQWLYVGAVDHKPPLIAATYAAVLGACGRYALHAVHAVSIAVVVLTGLLVGVVAVRLGFSRRAGRLATLLYVISAAMGPGSDMLAANAEVFMALPSVAAIALVTGAWEKDPRGRVPGLPRVAWLAVLAGICAALAALYKYQAAAVLAPALIVAWGLRSTGRRAVAAAALGAGALLPIAAVIVLYARAGHLDALRFWAWTFPLKYSASLGLAGATVNATLWSLAWAASNAVLLAAAWQGWREPPAGPRYAEARQALAIWIVTAAIGVAAGGRFFLHYYLQLMPPICVLAGAGAYRLFSRPARARAAAAALVVPLAGFSIASAANPLMRPDVARDTPVYEAVASVLRAEAGPHDTLFVWGNSSQIYVLARMSMGTRFPFCNYQSGKMWGTPADRDGASAAPHLVVKESWAMLIDDLDRRAPAWIVDAASAGLDRWRGHEIARYPRLAAIVARDYDIVARPGGAAIYRRRAERAVER